MIHSLVLIALSLVAWPFGWHVETAAIAAAFFCGREHAQAEYRAIITLFGGKRANAPWWCGFMRSAWGPKALMDWACPVAMSIAVASI